MALYEKDRVTVSCRLEYTGDVKVMLDQLFVQAEVHGEKIDTRLVLSKDPRMPIVEPLMEITLSETALVALVKYMRDNEQLNLHVPLETMSRLPIEQNPMERTYGTGIFDAEEYPDRLN